MTKYKMVSSISFNLSRISREPKSYDSKTGVTKREIRGEVHLPPKFNRQVMQVGINLVVDTEGIPCIYAIVSRLLG